jgi:hypothetical protein
MEEYFDAVAASTGRVRKVIVVSLVSVTLSQVSPPESCAVWTSWPVTTVFVVRSSHIPFSILANAALGAVITASVPCSELVEESAALTPVAVDRQMIIINAIQI